MTVVTEHLKLSSGGENDVKDLTEDVKRFVEETKLANGIVVVFVPGSTAAVTTIEFEPGLAKDFPDMLDRVAPKDRLTSIRGHGKTATGTHTSRRLWSAQA